MVRRKEVKEQTTEEKIKQLFKRIESSEILKKRVRYRYFTLSTWDMARVILWETDNNEESAIERSVNGTYSLSALAKGKRSIMSVAHDLNLVPDEILPYAWVYVVLYEYMYEFDSRHCIEALDILKKLREKIDDAGCDFIWLQHPVKIVIPYTNFDLFDEDKDCDEDERHAIYRKNREKRESFSEMLNRFDRAIRVDELVDNVEECVKKLIDYSVILDFNYDGQGNFVSTKKIEEVDHSIYEED